MWRCLNWETIVVLISIFLQQKKINNAHIAAMFRIFLPLPQKKRKKNKHTRANVVSIAQYKKEGKEEYFCENYWIHYYSDAFFTHTNIARAIEIDLFLLSTWNKNVFNEFYSKRKYIVVQQMRLQVFFQLFFGGCCQGDFPFFVENFSYMCFIQKKIYSDFFFDGRVAHASNGISISQRQY